VEYARPYWLPLSGGILATMINRMARLFPALSLAAAIDLAVNPSGTANGVLSALGVVPSEPMPLDDTGARLELLYYLGARLELLYYLGALAIGAYVVQSVSQFCSRYLFQTTAQRIQHDLRMDTYDHMQRLSLDFFNNHQTGGMMSILNSDINRLEDFFNAEIRELVALMNTRLSNNLGGAAIVKSFDRYDVERGRVGEQSGAYRDETPRAAGDVEQALREAARAAGAHEFIQELPDGYDTMVGERGVKLSGGQRQRVSIARTLLNDPDVIVLDEATSDVDTETEQLIQENLEALTADRTAFVIAHRLSTIQDADRIVVMEDGEVIETGTHSGLVDQEGACAGLWASQTDGSQARGVAGADD
jgi:ABC-type multidrug transport system fused ATPase/permease subunit